MNCYSCFKQIAIDYAAEMGYDEVNSMAERVTEQLQLDERQKEKLKSILSNVSTSLKTS